MKTAKKLIFMILVVAFAFIFAACNDNQTTHTHSFIEGSCECGEKDPNYVPPHTHSYSSVVTAPTCTEAGYTTFTCECGDTYKENGEAALGHTEVVDAAVDATCTEAGKTEGKHCSVCNEVLVAQEEVAATGHSYSSVVTATCTAAGVTTYTCSCGDTYTEETEKLGHIDADLDIECDREGCTSKIAPKADSLLSNATANHLGSKVSTSNKYYVEGTIVEVLDAKNGVFYIDDGTGEKFYFRLPVNEEGISHANWAVRLVVGDKVSVYGKINKYSTSTAPNGQYYPAMQSGVATLLEQHEHVFGEATCKEPAQCECLTITGEPLGHSDEDGDSLCDRCQFNVKLTLETLVVRTDNNSGVTTSDSTTWSSTNFDVIVAKGTSTQLYTTAKDHMRLYKGNTLTISNKTGITINSIIIHATNEAQVANIEKMLTGLTYTKNVVDFTITIEWNITDNLVLTNAGSSTQFKCVEITYEK